MLKLLAHRIALSIPLILLVSVVVFALESLVPGDPAQTVLGQAATPESIAALHQQMGLDQPWPERYWNWLSGLLHGNLGTSLFTGDDVVSALNTRLGITVSLVLCCVVVSAVVGTALGLFSAVRGGPAARVVDVLSLAGLALPNFWVAIVLVALFAVKVRLFPATGYVPFAESPGQWARSLVLPVIALSLFGITAVAKQARDSALDVLDTDYIRVLRGNGVAESRIVFKHVLRNAAIPVVTVLGVVAVSMLSGTVFVEGVFVLPGLGSLATQATTDHDLPVILGIGVYFTVVVIVINLLVDLAYGVLNPKVRAS
ncbi:ABC transporter permease [Amycolatopsis sacchari]|uniref:Peptide/nickel transport system permease protein n=1 Tax=Amycolatopsis sacchari TaxID=115433 RepID=A0A1I3UP14_9PSEU|nr:ABC transporter permease [Amycolatopsis sacchari]SFJ83611.1 peptide/nickel transport system permease protein [Amycolatopsis sacchari]